MRRSRGCLPIATTSAVSLRRPREATRPRRRALGPASLACALGFALGCLLGPIAEASGSEATWTTYHRDPGRSGYDPEGSGTGAPVEAWHSRDLGAPIWGQPLILGTRVYVATVGDEIYALDAATGNVLWEKSAGTPVPAGELPCGDISPTVGIVGTPVIDPSTGTLYAVADTWDPSAKEAHHVLKGYSLTSAAEVLSTPVDPPGSDPKALLQRTALNLDTGKVVFGMGGNDGDCAQYRGTAVVAPEGGGAPTYWQVLIAPPSTSGGAIWGTSGPVVDAEGTIYASTGNPNPPPGQEATTYDYSDSVVRLDTSLNLTGHFEPPSWRADSNADVDLGSAGPELLPGGLLFQAGKNGTGYLIDEATMGSGSEAVYSHEVCGGGSSFGGDAYAAGVIYMPCTNGTQALAYNQQARTFTPLWKGPSDAFGPPIVSGGLVWVVAPAGGTGKKLYGLDPATGKPRYTETLPTAVADHFSSPSAAGGRLFVATGSSVTAYALGAGTEQLPELGRCLRLKAPTTGRYANAGCTTKSSGENTGRFEWQPLYGGRVRFAGKSKAATFTTVGNLSIRCKTSSYAGEYSSARTATLTIRLAGCKSGPGAGVKCQGEGASAGEINTSPLEASLGFVARAPTTVIGLDLKPAAPGPYLMTFKCGESTSRVAGSVIGSFAVVDKMLTRFKLGYRDAEGRQLPQRFEGGTPDTLTLIPSSGPEEQAGLATRASLRNEAAVEIKAIE
jgi:polyvinyl alcohol dehydrogenase (cytochrome)